MIYLDHSSSTPCPPEVVEAVLPYFSQRSGDPSAVHGAGRAARQGVDHARRQVAALVKVHESQVIFTSDGSEANQLALFGVASRGGFRGHLLLSGVEHPSLLMTAALLEQRGLQVTRVGVDETGRVNPEEVKAELREDTLLVSIQHANGETGVVQPVAEIGRLCRERNLPYHCDASHSAGRIPLSLSDLPCSLLTLAGHTLGAPHGVGALVVEKKIALDPMLVGSSQERGRRAGLENLTGIVGFGSAAALAQHELEQESSRVQGLRDRLEKDLLSRFPALRILGAGAPRLPHVSAFSLPHLDGETMVMQLDLAGIAVSSGSRCSSGRNEPSHVTRAMGLPPEYMGGVIRVSFGRRNTLEEVERLLATLDSIVPRLMAATSFLPK